TRTDSPLGQERPQPLPQPATTSPAAPITFPATNPSSPLSNALASCETGADTSEFTLPSTRRDVNLDRCSRGHDHLGCQSTALMTEAKSLLENYRKIIDANYPELRDLDGICSIKAEALSNDLHAATEFEGRFRAFKAEYEARSACANRIEQSLKQVSFHDMTQAADLAKS